MELPNPNGLLPDQEERRHLIAPPDEELIALRPKNQTHIKILLDAAVLAGYDAKGMSDSRSYKVPPKSQPRYAEEDVPVLVITPRKAVDEPQWDEPVAPVSTPELDEDDPDDIFAVIRRGRRAQENKP
jgi:hypothetical protein